MPQLVVGFTRIGDELRRETETGPLQTMCQGSIKVASITLSTMATAHAFTSRNANL